MGGKLVVVENGVAQTPITLPKEVFHCTMYDDGTSCYESSGKSEQEIENAISAGKLVVCSFITMHSGDILTTELMASSVLGPYPVFTGTCRTSSGLLAFKVTYDEETSTAQQEWWSVERTYIPSGNTLYEPVTYSQILSKISNSQLVAGKSYRITDYVTTTAQANTSSAGHAFDLVVTAIDVNKLDCRASAVLHSGDTYFSTAGADLSKWQIWYDVVNDANKYEWADSIKGKGVIYRMIDEWGNECPYDFKNMLFTKVNVYSAAYTFNKFASGDASNTDHSLNGTYCHGNRIKEAISNLRTLNFIVFLNGSATSYCENNTFGKNCSNNTFGNSCSNNTFGKNCSSNTFEGTCIYNRIGGNCITIKVGAGGQFNTFGDNCQNIRFGNVCSYNKIGENCSAIVFGDTSGNGGERIRDVIIENSNSYIRVFCASSGYAELRNIFIAQGCSGTSSAYTEISTIERNLAYRTTVGRDSSGNIRIYNEDDPASAPAPPITIDTALSETSTNPVQNKAINVLTRKLWDKVDIVPRLDNEYVRRNLYIVSSTNNKWGGTSTSNYKHWIVPVSDMREVIITANANTAQAYSFFKSYPTPVSGDTPDYATGYSGIKSVSVGETLKITVPNDAEFLYINTGNNGAAKAVHIYITGIGISANVQSDWNQTDSSADDFIKNKPTIPTLPDIYTEPSELGIAYGTCTSTISERACEVNMQGDFNLKNGAIINVKFTNATSAGMSITIDGTTMDVMYQGQAIAAGCIQAGDTAQFVLLKTQGQSGDTWTSHLVNVDRWSSISGLDDTEISSLNTNHLLLYNGTKWTNIRYPEINGGFCTPSENSPYDTIIPLHSTVDSFLSINLPWLNGTIGKPLLKIVFTAYCDSTTSQIVFSVTNDYRLHFNQDADFELSPSKPYKLVTCTRISDGSGHLSFAVEIKDLTTSSSLGNNEHPHLIAAT